MLILKANFKAIQDASDVRDFVNERERLRRDREREGVSV